VERGQSLLDGSESQAYSKGIATNRYGLLFTHEAIFSRKDFPVKFLGKADIVATVLGESRLP